LSLEFFFVFFKINFLIFNEDSNNLTVLAVLRLTEKISNNKWYFTGLVSDAELLRRTGWHIDCDHRISFVLKNHLCRCHKLISWPANFINFRASFCSVGQGSNSLCSTSHQDFVDTALFGAIDNLRTDRAVFPWRSSQHNSLTSSYLSWYSQHQSRAWKDSCSSRNI